VAGLVYHCQVMADSKLAALQATAAAPFTTTLQCVGPSTKPIGLLTVGHPVIDVALSSLRLPLAGSAAARVLPAPAER
jgi:hypothetical protein